MLVNNETLTTDYNQAINGINEGKLVTFHVLEELDFANYKYPKQPWLNIANHNGIIAPLELQIARFPSIKECRVIERETHTILARQPELTDGVGLRILANSLETYKGMNLPVVYATW